MKFKQLSDTISRNNAKQNIANLQSKFDIETKEKENEILLANQEKQELIIQKQKTYNILSTIAIFLFLGLLGLLYNTLRQRKRHFATLYAKNQEILQQKEEIITQNDVLIQQNKEIELQRNELQHYKTNVQASITYARRIQSSLMPDISDLKQVYSQVALINKPRDIISGDFLFFKKFEHKSILIVADCTGHGVPGALMSILNMTILKELLRENANMSSAQLLNKTREIVKTDFKQESTIKKVNDGMDASVILYNKENQEINFAGAYRPLYIFKNNEFISIEADKQPVSAFIKEKPFTDNYIKAAKNDILYVFSDGIYDQISQNHNSKYGLKKFREFLKSIHNNDLDIQTTQIIEEWEKWKEDTRQTDDIILVVVKI